MLEVLAKGLAKNIEEAVIKCWYFEEGDEVTKGDDLLELVAADESVVIISAPVTGVLAEVFFEGGETVQRDEVLCLIDDAEAKLKDEDEEDKDDDEGDVDDDKADDEESEDDY